MIEYAVLAAAGLFCGFCFFVLLIAGAVRLFRRPKPSGGHAAAPQSAPLSFFRVPPGESDRHVTLLDLFEAHERKVTRKRRRQQMEDALFGMIPPSGGGAAPNR